MIRDMTSSRNISPKTSVLRSHGKTSEAYPASRHRGGRSPPSRRQQEKENIYASPHMQQFQLLPISDEAHRKHRQPSSGRSSHTQTQRTHVNRSASEIYDPGVEIQARNLEEVEYAVSCHSLKRFQHATAMRKTDATKRKTCRTIAPAPKRERQLLRQRGLAHSEPMRPRPWSVRRRAGSLSAMIRNVMARVMRFVRARGPVTKDNSGEAWECGATVSRCSFENVFSVIVQGKS
jgi:hypothetical protein